MMREFKFLSKADLVDEHGYHHFFDVVQQEYIDSLKEEIERLKKEVADYHQLQWQHDALIDENEKLEAELNREEKLMAHWGIEGLTTITENNRALCAENEKLKARNKYLENFVTEEKEVFTPSKIKIIEDLSKENKRLRCLALHAMCRWLDSWSIGVGINIMKHRKFGLFYQIKRHLRYYSQAYCEAKRELKCAAGN